MSLATNPTAEPARPGSAPGVHPDVTHWTDKASRPNNEDFYTVPPYDNLPGAASVSATRPAARGLVE